MTDIFQEVEEDLRREELIQLWRKYGPYLIGLAALVVLAVGGMQGYRYIAEERSKERAGQFLAATELVSTDPGGAALALEKIAAKNDGYGVMAEFRLAHLKAVTGDNAAALAAYEKIVSETKADDPLHDLAILKSGYLMLDRASQAGLEERLGPVATGDGPWRHAALEILAFGALKAGNLTKARERFDALAKDGTAPEGMASRARDMASTLPPAPAATPAVPAPEAPATPAPAPPAPQQP